MLSSQQGSIKRLEKASNNKGHLRPKREPKTTAMVTTTEEGISHFAASRSLRGRRKTKTWNCVECGDPLYGLL